MNTIARFFTLYWIVYYPTCIAFNDLPGFSSIDEVMTGVLIVFTFMMKRNESTNPEPWREYITFLWILTFYVVYSLIMAVNVRDAVWLDLFQQIRPYSIIYCTWILNPRFTENQKRWILTAMIATLVAWFYYHPTATQVGVHAEFPVLGQLAISTGMAYYLFTEETKRNKYIAVLIVLSGMLAPKFKFMGEVVCFMALVFYVKRQLDFKSPKTAVFMALLMTAVVIFTWTKFEVYYVSGWNNSELARPQTYKTALLILADYFPFGPGMGTFAANGAMKFYSPLYPAYGLDHIWGLSPRVSCFICDAFYPTLAQFGIVGVILFVIYWKRRLTAMNAIRDMRYYRVAMMAFFCLAIEQTADSSWLSGKGMGFCMLIGLCLNANLNSEMDEEEYDNESDESSELEDEDDLRSNREIEPSASMALG